MSEVHFRDREIEMSAHAVAPQGNEPAVIPDHMRDTWSKLTPDERLTRTLRLHRLRRQLLGLE